MDWTDLNAESEPYVWMPKEVKVFGAGVLQYKVKPFIKNIMTTFVMMFIPLIKT